MTLHLDTDAPAPPPVLATPGPWTVHPYCSPVRRVRAAGMNDFDAGSVCIGHGDKVVLEVRFQRDVGPTVSRAWPNVSDLDEYAANVRLAAASRELLDQAMKLAAIFRHPAQGVTIHDLAELEGVIDKALNGPVPELVDMGREEPTEAEVRA